MLTIAHMAKGEVFTAVEWASTPHGVGFFFIFLAGTREGSDRELAVECLQQVQVVVQRLRKLVAILWMYVRSFANDLHLTYAYDPSSLLCMLGAHLLRVVLLRFRCLSKYLRVPHVSFQHNVAQLQLLLL